MKSLLRAAVVVTATLLAVSAVAQMKGVPASVTSSGTPGKGVAPGVPASATFHGSSSLQGPDNCCAAPTPLIPSAMGLRNPFFNTNVSTNGVEQGRAFHLRGRRRQQEPLVVPYYIPYGVPVMADEYDQAPPEPDQYEQEPEPPAPTIFEHRPMVQRRADPARAAVAVEVAPDPVPAPPEREQEPTLLIFKDGRKVEIRNFAIVGENVIELSPEYRRIPLAELDVPATVKENDARGLEFHVPVHRGS